MKIVYGTTTLGDSADLSMVPHDFACNGRQSLIGRSDPIGSITSAFFGRGGRSVDVSVTVDYGFASYEEAAEYAMAQWNSLLDQADLELTLGTLLVTLADACLQGPEIVAGSLGEVACLIRWSWVGGAFTTTSGGSAVTSILDYQALTPSAAGNTTPSFVSGKRSKSLLVQAAAGAGTYTHIVILPTTDRQTGDRVEARLELVASANPTIEFRNATSGGTLLASRTGTTLGAANYCLLFTYNGSAWVLLNVLNEA